MQTIRVMVVDDSPVMRSFMADAIARAPGFEVVATAHNASDAWAKIQSEGPDVITLDVEMPDMDGITFLERLMQLHPMSVVMVSALTQSGAQTTLRALQLGAADFVGKPLATQLRTDTTWLDELLLKLRRAAQLRPTRLAHGRSDYSAPAQSAQSSSVRSARKCLAQLIAIGTGSSGTNGLSQMLVAFPRDCPPAIVAAHLPALVTRALVARLSKDAVAQVKLAEDGARLSRGQIYLAPGDIHVGVTRVGPDIRVRLHPGEPVRGCRPSIDLLFESAAKHAGSDTIGLLLDSIGDDGVSGLRVLCSSGGKAIRQVPSVDWSRVPSDVNAPILSALSSVQSARAREATLQEIPDLMFGAGATWG